MIFNANEIKDLYLANCEIYNSCKMGYKFEENHQPHLTFYQCFLEADHIPLAIEVAQSAAKEFSLGSELLSSGHDTAIRYREKDCVATLGIEDVDGNLFRVNQFIHESLKKSVLLSTSKEEAFFGGFAGKDSLNWVANYPSKSESNSFSPHITYGFGQPSLCAEISDRMLSEKYWITPRALVVGQMGDLCSATSEIYQTIDLPCSGLPVSQQKNG